MLRPAVPAGMGTADMALRFVLSNPDVTTVIPGMRSPERVAQHVHAAESGPLSPELLAQLRARRWDRTPTGWSQ